MKHPVGNILIVDDEEDTAMLVSDGLRRRGYNTQYVTSAVRCLETLSSEPIDVVITDVQMPGMSGIELCKQVRDRHPTCASIVLTGLRLGELADAASRAGALELLTKPAKLDTLDKAVERALERIRALS